MNVYDCTKPDMAVAETSKFNKSGELLYHYKFADPQILNLSMGIKLAPGSVGAAARNIACHEDLGTPLVSKRQLAEMKFHSLSSTISGDGEIFYELSPHGQDVQNQKQIVFIVKYNGDRDLNTFYSHGTSIPDPPNVRTEVDHIVIKCDENKFGAEKVESWSASNELVRVMAFESIKFSEFQKFSPFASLQEIACGKGYAGVGIRFGSDNGLIKVGEVFAGSPAEKSGVKTNDVLTQIDNEPIGGWTTEQVAEKLRGPANSSVVLKVLRNGETNPIDLAVTREIIHVQSAQEGTSK